MAIILEQQFILGRFHATRWRQSPFEDPYGEWPPSPWRLLRALAARWYQYVREIAATDEGILHRLLACLASSLPCYVLPEMTWNGPQIRQYQPVGVDQQYKYKKDPATGKSVPDYEYLAVTKTLMSDRHRVLPTDAPLLWVWMQGELDHACGELLDALLQRILYFGRSESACQFRRLDALPDGTAVNCVLSAIDGGDGHPVLAHDPAHALKTEVLLCSTDEIRNRSLPPGTRWFYADIPPKPRIQSRRRAHTSRNDQLKLIQFAVGGRVYPPPDRWIRIAERVRGRALKLLAEQLSGDSKATYGSLPIDLRERVALIAGKNGNGEVLEGHRHAFFLLWPDEHGLPTRLIVYRRERFFSAEELHSILGCADRSVSWTFGADWSVRLVPLPVTTPPPPGFCNSSKIWKSVTPFVPPSNRRKFRKNGAERRSETPERALMRLIRAAGLPEPEITRISDVFTNWQYLHETRTRRLGSDEVHTPLVRPGFNMQLKFDTPIEGPVLFGDSCHFGLGMFGALP